MKNCIALSTFESEHFNANVECDKESLWYKNTPCKLKMKAII